jgi:hypothetical protein
MARKPGIAGTQFGLNGGTSRQSADYAAGKFTDSGKINLLADTPYWGAARRMTFPIRRIGALRGV